MSREEIVQLVSRAIAIIQAITALLYVTFVPDYLFSENHYAQSSGYLGTIHRIEVVSLLVRIVGLSVLSWLFWRCGPWVAGLLFPARDAIPSGTE
jgi:hypothetical protein